MSRTAAGRAPADVSPSVERQRLLERCQRAVEEALTAGAEEAEAFASAHRGTSVQLEKGDLQLARSQESETLGLRVFVGGQLGFASSNQADDSRALGALGEEALALARLSPPDPAAGLLVGGAVAPLPFLMAPPLWSIAPERVVTLGGELLERVRALDRRISVDQGEVAFARGTSAVASSRGVTAAESDAGLSVSLFGMAIDGTDVGGFGVESDWTRAGAELEGRLERLAARFGREVLGNLGAGRAESYRGAVLFAPDAVLDLFVGPLVGALSALAVQRGRSALAGKLDQAVADARVELVDDPSDPELAGAASSDREGTLALRRPLVAGGVLQSYLYNARAARQEGLERSTGHAVGGARGVPGIGPHALVLGAGDGGDQHALAERVGRGLLVGRFSGTVDPTSGDFSGVAKSARWIEGGVPVRAVGETLIAGNAFRALHDLVALSSHTEVQGGRHRMPWALVDGLSVTAG